MYLKTCSNAISYKINALYFSDKNKLLIIDDITVNLPEMLEWNRLDILAAIPVFREQVQRPYLVQG